MAKNYNEETKTVTYYTVAILGEYGQRDEIHFAFPSLEEARGYLTKTFRNDTKAEISLVTTQTVQIFTLIKGAE